MGPSLTFIQAAGTVAVCEVGLCLDSHRTGGSDTAEAGPLAEEGAGNGGAVRGCTGCWCCLRPRCVQERRQGSGFELTLLPDKPASGPLWPPSAVLKTPESLLGISARWPSWPSSWSWSALKGSQVSLSTAFVSRDHVGLAESGVAPLHVFQMLKAM